ncbi:TPA: hypothetical protein OO234_000139 [Shigella flexneri]|nr:hypothetical protein [Shigella flexneri]
MALAASKISRKNATPCLLAAKMRPHLPEPFIIQLVSARKSVIAVQEVSRKVMILTLKKIGGHFCPLTSRKFAHSLAAFLRPKVINTEK